MDNTATMPTADEIARTLAPLVEAFQEIADIINDFVRYVVKVMDALMIEIARVLNPFLLDLAALYVEIQRETLFVRLHERGVPVWLAHWLAWHCPRRWLPGHEEIVRCFYG